MPSCSHGLQDVVLRACGSRLARDQHLGAGLPLQDHHKHGGCCLSGTAEIPEHPVRARGCTLGAGRQGQGSRGGYGGRWGAVRPSLAVTAAPLSLGAVEAVAWPCVGWEELPGDKSETQAIGDSARENSSAA